METTRWNILVSVDTDRALRVFLANRGGKKGDLSKFIEDAVRARLLELTAEEAKTANLQVDEGELAAVIDGALQWAHKS
jgi:hypothetical protein